VSQDPCNRQGRGLLREAAIAVGHVEKNVRAECGVARLFGQPIKYRFKRCSTAAIYSMTTKVGMGMLVVFLYFVDLGVALQEGQPALGETAEFIDLRENLAQLVIAHGTGGVDGSNHMAWARSTDTWQVQPAPNVFLLEGNMR